MAALANVHVGDNVLITATSSENETSISAGGAGGGTAAIAINAGVPVLNITTKAFVADGASAGGGATIYAPGNMNVAADEQTNLQVISGNLTFSGTASIGAAAAVPIITKTTEAYVGQFANITVLGSDANGITVNSGALNVTTTPTTFTPQSAISGNVINLPYNANLMAGQQVVYYTDGGTAIGGLTDGTTYYVIIPNAANPNSIELATSAANASAGTPITLNKAAATGSLHRVVATNQVNVQDSKNGGSDTSAMTSQTSVTPGTVSNFHGLAVTATNRDELATAGVSGGGSGTVAINVGGSIDVSNITTSASISSGAAVNANNAGAGVNQSVLVGAGNDYHQLGIAGAISISGTVSVSPGADVRVIHLNTSAFIADTASVTVRNDVAVSANATGKYLSIAAGAAGSGTVAVGGALSVTVLNDVTDAYIGNAAASLANGAIVNAGGNVLVSANDSTNVNAIAGSLGLGIGAVGVGASIGVIDITKSTQAFVGPFATVNAAAKGTDSLTGIYGDENTGTGAFNLVNGTGQASGLAVQAVSSETVFSVAVSGAAGFYAGVAGGVTVELISSNTTAYVGNNAIVNTASGAGAAQAVNIAAVNSTNVNSTGGGLGGGIAGIGGAVDVGVVKNNTVAYIGQNATVDAAGDINVNALSSKNVTSKALSAAGGLVAAAGSLSVWTIGTDVVSTYSDNSKPQTDSLSTSGGTPQGEADSSASGSQTNGGYTSILSGFTNGGSASNSPSGRVASQTNSADTTIGSNAPNGVVSGAVTDKSSQMGTTAYTDQNATAAAGGSVGVRAKENVTFNGIVGDASGGGLALGASIAIINIKSNTDAHIGAAQRSAPGRWRRTISWSTPAWVKPRPATPTRAMPALSPWGRR